MDILHSEIGSAKDNFKSPIHNWYKFTAGFSYKFVEGILNFENLSEKKKSMIFDPFSGCGTTLVSCQKQGVKIVGNESQAFMLDVIKAKLNWKISVEKYQECLLVIKNYISDNNETYPSKEINPLLESLYSESTLHILYLIKDSLDLLSGEKYKLFFKLALSQTLHKVSIHPIAVPYISRTKKLKNDKSPWLIFENICNKMIGDLVDLKGCEKTAKVYNHDSRKRNRFIKSKSCDLCITSPPYLNNLDYGEVSKVHTHFFGITKDWGDITKKVRKKLVTGATTHYKEKDFDEEEYLASTFSHANKAIVKILFAKAELIRNISNERTGRKSFDILMLLYFKDMYNVLLEIKRVLKKNGKAYLILGDSAPYGVHVKTTTILAEIALNSGFNSYNIQKIRSRGTKWKSLKHRHSLQLSENLLILE